MNKRRYRVIAFFEAAECPKCSDGILKERIAGVQYMTDPPMANFKCNECGGIARLIEDDFPGMRFEVDFNQEIITVI